MPRNALRALVSALLIFPGMLLIDLLSRPCGDGLCGFFPGLMVFGVLFIATIVFTIAGFRNNEQPRWMLILSWLPWLTFLIF